MSQGKRVEGRIFKPGDFCKGGRYKIFHLLGAGGMGEVWTAFDEQAADYDHQWVAVKVLQAKLGFDDESKLRLVREASTLLKLKHPNLVKVLHADVDEERHLFFYVMELLEGETIDAKIKRTGGLELDEALRIYADILDGVHVLHLLGIIHRDLKPENIFLTKDGRVVVLDLGVAKFDPQRFPDRAQPTGPGVILGTCAYMSPEQCLGDPLDPRSDLYAVGLIAYAGLFGAHAAKAGHKGELPHDYKQWAGWHLHQAPRPLTEVLPWLDPEVWTVIAKALAKDPQDRYESAAELSAVLHALRASQKAKGNRRPPSSATRPSAAAKASRPDPTALLPLATTEESEVRSSPAAVAPVPVIAASLRSSQPAPRAEEAARRPSQPAPRSPQPPRSAAPEVTTDSAPGRRSEAAPERRSEPAPAIEPPPSAPPATPVPRTAGGTEIIAIGPVSASPRTARGTEIIRVQPPSRAQSTVAGSDGSSGTAGDPVTDDAAAEAVVGKTARGSVPASSVANQRRKRGMHETGASQSTPVTHDVPLPEAKRSARFFRENPPISRRLAFAFAGGGVAIGLGIAALLNTAAGSLRGSSDAPAVASTATAAVTAAPVSDSPPQQEAPTASSEPPATAEPITSAAPSAAGASSGSAAPGGSAAPTVSAVPTTSASAMPASPSRTKAPWKPQGASPNASSGAAPITAPPAPTTPPTTDRKRLPTNPSKPYVPSSGSKPKSDRILD